jgi:hypothetical protein
VTVLGFFDVVLLVVAAPIMLLIGVPASGYGVAAGAWIALRAVGVAVDRYAEATREANRQISVRLGFMLGPERVQAHDWVNLGIFSINKAVVYLFLAAILTCATMIYVARRMKQRPNRVQTAVEFVFQGLQNNVVGANMDSSDGGQVVSLHRHARPVHLLLEPRSATYRCRPRPRPSTSSACTSRPSRCTRRRRTSRSRSCSRSWCS